MPLVLSQLPIPIGITGKRRNIIIRLGDLLYGNRMRDRNIEVKIVINRKQINLNVNTANINERLLLYAGKNVIASYTVTPFYSVMKALLSPGDIFIDIGANLGIYSLLAKYTIGAGTICFEPEPIHFDFLNRNRLHFDQVYGYALSDSDGEASFFISGQDNPGGSSLVMSDRGWDKSGYVKEIKVVTRRFDSIITQDIMERTGLIKVDVEGNEYKTLLGMKNILASDCTPPIWCEVRGPESDRNPNSYLSVIDYLNSFGYKPYYLSSKGKQVFTDLKQVAMSQVFDLLFLKNIT